MDAPANLNIDTRRYLEGPGLVTHLMVLTHFVEKRSLAMLACDDANHGKLSLAYSGFVSLLAEREHSPGELAAQLGISKQACSNTLRELEQQGLIARRRNPRDSRSTVVSLTDEGAALLRAGIACTNQLHDEFAATLGEEQLERLGSVLERAARLLGVDIPVLHALQADARDQAHPRRLTLLLPGLSTYFRRSLGQDIAGRGFGGLKTSHGPLLGLVNREGRRLQYIASVLGHSKQAVAATSLELERLGYVVREADPEDKRQIVLRLSPEGTRLVDASQAAVRERESALRELLGADDYQCMDEALATLYFQVVDEFDPPSVLPEKIQQLGDYLISELGTAGARTLAQHLMTITRGDT
ncbi:MarR family transcriptional regulator [Mangrovimicrobium sediminis]|uniref:MarR family transcriptional regulator n=1 Tax=Mangrovimicrobium sediminis TaxID=2562682 RepID=A0A4Z0LWG2_9GAMM|nr:MarR family transcriptional regulator [Haliea sp. SAOS-164]TGD71405.1 MarR family transcriptional regulator [Haliea sp. SAOS-164]